MELDRAVLVMTNAAEHILGERMEFTKEGFNRAAAEPGVVALREARHFMSNTVPMGEPDATGRTMFRIVFDLMPIEPLTRPALVTYVAPSRWIHLEDCDDSLMKDMLHKLLKHVEDREVELRASAAGIILGPSIEAPGGGRR
jgi:hypothetical protein